jgi:hypothetical protein
MVAGRKMIDPHRLVQRWRGLSDEEAVAQVLNAYLGDGWPVPPWSVDQVATLQVVLELENNR